VKCRDRIFNLSFTLFLQHSLPTPSPPSPSHSPSPHRIPLVGMTSLIGPALKSSISFLVTSANLLSVSCTERAKQIRIEGRVLTLVVTRSLRSRFASLAHLQLCLPAPSTFLPPSVELAPFLSPDGAPETQVGPLRTSSHHRVVRTQRRDVGVGVFLLVVVVGQADDAVSDVLSGDGGF